MRNGSKFTMATPNTEAFTTLLNQLGGLIGSSADLEDICVSSAANLWARYKSFAYQGYFSSDAERERIRTAMFYGIRIAEYGVEGNSAMKYLRFYRDTPDDGYTPPYYKRIRDWNGYNHSAKSAILLKQHDSASVTDTVVLETNAIADDNVSMRDLLVKYSDMDSFMWKYVDWFGFEHDLSTVYTKDSIMSYLFGNSSKISINIANKYFNAASGGYMSLDYIPPKVTINAKSHLGLAGWYFPSDKRLLNAMTFSSTTINSAPVSIEGWCPDMLIGTAARGKGYLRDNIYTGINIDCASDDFLFMGFTLRNVSNESFTMSRLKIYLYQGGTVVPKSLPISVYNKSDFNTALVPNGAPLGVSKPTDSITTAWAKGMFFIRLDKIWSNLVNGTGYFAIVYEQTEKLPYSRQLLTPYVRLTLNNTNRLVSTFDKKATLPEVIPPSPNWNTVINL